MLHAGMVMDQGDGLDLAIQRVQEALDRVIAAWQVEHLDLHLDAPDPSPAWHSNPCEPPAATIQRAEVACLQASALCQSSVQVNERAVQLYREAHSLRVFRRRLVADHDPATFTRVGPAILASTRRSH